MTGTADAIIRALRTEIDGRRQHLDAATDIGEVTITVKLQPGTAWVRRLVYQEERIYHNRLTNSRNGL